MLNETHPTHILLSLDALRYGEARSQVAFVPETHVAFVPPGDEHEDEETETWKLKMTLPRTVVIQGVRRKTFKVDLALIGQLCEEGFTLETAVADGGNFATTVQFSLQERRGPGTRLLWSDAQRAVEELHRLVDEPIDTSSFVWHDEETGLMRLRMKGFQVHHPSATHGFPFYDADGDRIVFSEASQVPFGAAMHTIFCLQCVRKADGMLSMQAKVSSLSLL